MRVKLNRALQYSDSSCWLEFSGVEQPELSTRIYVSEQSAYELQMILDNVVPETTSIHTFLQQALPQFGSNISEVVVEPFLPAESAAMNFGIDPQVFFNAYRENYAAWKATVILDDGYKVSARVGDALRMGPPSIIINESYLHSKKQNDAILPAGARGIDGDVSPVTFTPADYSNYHKSLINLRRFARRGRPVKVEGVDFCIYQREDHPNSLMEKGVMVFHPSSESSAYGKGQACLEVSIDQFEYYRLAKRHATIGPYQMPPPQLVVSMILEHLGGKFDKISATIGYGKGLFFQDCDGPIILESSNGKAHSIRMRPTDAICLQNWGMHVDVYVSSVLLKSDIPLLQVGAVPKPDQLKQGVMIPQYLPSETSYII